MHKSFVILCSILLISIAAKAHQPNLSSTVLIEQKEDTWLLQVRTSLTAFEHEVVRLHGDSAYATPEGFQRLVVDLVRSNVYVVLNGKDTISLAHGLVNLGHETSVTFQLSPALKDIKSLTIHNGTFRDIHQNKGLVFVIKEGFTEEKFVLNNENNQTVNLIASHQKFELAETVAKRYVWYAGAGATALLLSGLVVVFLVRKKNKKRTTR